MSANINEFEKQIDYLYKNEQYSVRDNGSVLRHARQNKSIRKLDNLWTFGTVNNHGYLLIGAEVVHRIVAYAFLGEPPTPQHIVDHIDSNRQNNRPENLRWLTKLENILNNPITIKKIEFHCGSIEAFLNDPSLLKNYENQDPNFKWMRAVSPLEAQLSWERLNSWAKKKSHKDNAQAENRLGEWIFQGNSSLSENFSALTKSETKNAVQINWKTPSKFPYCPQTITNNPIETYAASLEAGKIFSSNQHSNYVIVSFATSKDNETLWILSKNSSDKTMKPWSLAEVTFEENLFIHKNLGSYFKQDGAEKYFLLAQGLDWTGGDTFDDLT